jgi:hypothetical protein
MHADDGADGSLFDKTGRGTGGGGGEGGSGYGIDGGEGGGIDGSDAESCSPPRAGMLRKLGWNWNAWKYFPSALGDNHGETGGGGGSSERVVYSVGVGQGLTLVRFVAQPEPSLSHCH